MTLQVQEQEIDLVYCEEVHPTVFSLFLANRLEVFEKDLTGCDLGTGSGILAITLARLGMERVVAVDRSAIACEVAEENVRRNGVAGQVEVVHGDLADMNLSGFDLAVCNPPTMPDVEVTPGFASGGSDPLDVVRLVASKLRYWLSPSGRCQISLSSLVAEEAVDVFERSGLASMLEASLLAPFRPFYKKAYSKSQLDSFLAEGRVLGNGVGDLQTLWEIISVYTLSRAQQ
jgi:methylase of polypeptide subunit release factors